MFPNCKKKICFFHHIVLCSIFDMFPLFICRRVVTSSLCPSSPRFPGSSSTQELMLKVGHKLAPSIGRYRNYSVIELCGRFQGMLNPLTLRVALESDICYSHTFGKNLGIKRKFAKYFKESCCLYSDQHFSFKCFQKNAFVRKIFPKLSGLFWPL